MLNSLYIIWAPELRYHQKYPQKLCTQSRFTQFFTLLGYILSYCHSETSCPNGSEYVEILMICFCIGSCWRKKSKVCRLPVWKLRPYVVSTDLLATTLKTTTLGTVIVSRSPKQILSFPDKKGPKSGFRFLNWNIRLFLKFWIFSSPNETLRKYLISDRQRATGKYKIDSSWTKGYLSLH